MIETTPKKDNYWQDLPSAPILPSLLPSEPDMKFLVSFSVRVRAPGINRCKKYLSRKKKQLSTNRTLKTQIGFQKLNISHILCILMSSFKALRLSVSLQVCKTLSKNDTAVTDTKSLTCPCHKVYRQNYIMQINHTKHPTDGLDLEIAQ